MTMCKDHVEGNPNEPIRRTTTMTFMKDNAEVDTIWQHTKQFSPKKASGSEHTLITERTFTVRKVATILTHCSLDKGTFMECSQDSPIHHRFNILNLMLRGRRFVGE